MLKSKNQINQKNLIIGTLLGDGNLQTFTEGRTWRYRAVHKAEHFDYLIHKYNILKDICESEPIYEDILDTRTNKNYKRFYFNTCVHSSLRFYANLFYEKGLDGKYKKVIPKNIEKWLNAEVMAYFFQDDGALKWKQKSNAMRICTECFTLLEVKRLIKAISNKFNINLNLTKVKKKNIIVGYRLYINEANSSAFRELIRPYLLESMKYKVSDGNKNNL